MIPGAPSLTTSSGSPRPLARKVVEERPHGLDVLLQSPPSAPAAICVRPRRSPRRPEPLRAAGPAAAARRRHQRTDRPMAGSERSRLQKSSCSAHRRSLIPLAAARDRSRLPVSSVNASSMARLDRPRAESSTASHSSSRVRAPKAQARAFEMNGSGGIADLRARIFPSSPCPADNRRGRPPSRPRLHS